MAKDCIFCRIAKGEVPAEKFYEERGDADGLRRVQEELQDLDSARKLVHQNWEETLPELSATTPTAQADKLLVEADALRKKWNPLKRGENHRAAALKYKELLQKYPDSTAVDSAAFGLGEIHSGGSLKDYERAVNFFELAYLANENTAHEALYRAAQVCDGDRADYENAARFYWLASQKGVGAITRQKAAMRLKALQKRGYGAAYAPAEETASEEGAAETKGDAK